MNDISVFFNNRTVDERSCGDKADIYREKKKSFSMADDFVGLGDYFLTPVRCLFNGNNVTVSLRNQFVTVEHVTEYPDGSGYIYIIAQIVLLVPGLIGGIICKGLGYLSKSIREAHSFVIQHYTPLDITVGTEEKRLPLNEIRKKLIEEKGNNPFNQPVRIIVYAEPNTEINEDPGFLALDPQKIILVGAKIIHGRSLSLDNELSKKVDWKCKNIREVKDGNQANFNINTFITQWPVNSVKEALQDSPNEKRVYVIKGLALS